MASISVRDIRRRLRRLTGTKPRQAKLKLEGQGGSRPAEKRVLPARRDLAFAVARMREDGARRVVVYGSAAQRDEFQAAAPEIECHWVSSAFDDLQLGAEPPGPETLAAGDAVLVGGGDVQTSYRTALQYLCASSPGTPVHWVHESFEFCRATLPIPAEIERADVLVFNTFEQFFAVKDRLLFEIELLSNEHGRRRFTRILRPDETLRVDPDAILPQRRDGPVCLSVTIAHPILTRGRHNRFRVTADLFWNGSFTTIHSAHQVVPRPDRAQEYRLAESTVRSGRLAVTIPNYDLDLGPHTELHYGNGEREGSLTRDPARFLEVVSSERPATRPAGRHLFHGRYHGYGTAFWYAFEEGALGGGRTSASLSANHLGRMDVEDRRDAAATPSESELLAAIEKSGFMVYPCALPVQRGRDDLQFGFSYDTSNPPVHEFAIHLFDDEGRRLGRIDLHHPGPSPVWIDDVVAGWPDPARERASLALVHPDWEKTGLAPERVDAAPDMILRHAQSGDRDVTEFQTSWRNMGVVIPELPHWLHPALGVFNRTNQLGRVRTADGMRTALLLVNASGNLRWSTAAEVEVRALRLDGRPLATTLRVPAFTGRMVWLDECMPGLAEHLGADGVGSLQIRSPDADLCIQMITLDPGGRVSLQHLWGY